MSADDVDLGAARNAFLLAPNVVVLSVTRSPDKAPLVVPLWFQYDQGHFWILTPQGSRKTEHLPPGKEVSLCVVGRDDPYEYVSVVGVIRERSIGVDESFRVEFARKYLGDAARGFVRDSPHSSGDLFRVKIEPIRWSSRLR